MQIQFDRSNTFDTTTWRTFTGWVIFINFINGTNYIRIKSMKTKISNSVRNDNVSVCMHILLWVDCMTSKLVDKFSFFQLLWGPKQMSRQNLSSILYRCVGQKYFSKQTRLLLQCKFGFSWTKLYQPENVIFLKLTWFPVEFIMIPPPWNFFFHKPPRNILFFSNFDIPPGFPTTFTTLPSGIFHW